MNPQPTGRYDAPSQVLHWLTAIAVAAAFILGPEHFGRLIHDGLDPATRSDIVWHESLGIAVVVLTLLRLVWVALRPAAPQNGPAGWMQLAGKAMHLALWVLLLAVPASALMALGSEGHPLTLLGGVRVDHLPLIANSAVARLADWGDVHGFMGDAIVWLAGLHAAAAIYHQVMLHDGVLVSMLPWGRVR